jgi:hypothetical protein
MGILGAFTMSFAMNSSAICTKRAYPRELARRIQSASSAQRAWLPDSERVCRKKTNGLILYTIIESCRCRGINPYAYLRDVLTRLPSMTNWQVKQVTPEAWAKTLRSSTTATAA